MSRHERPSFLPAPTKTELFFENAKLVLKIVLFFGLIMGGNYCMNIQGGGGSGDDYIPNNSSYGSF